MPPSMYRSIERLVSGRETSDGAGVKLTRVIGTSLHTRLDPFLMLDAFKNDEAADYIGGFPDHPHRGFETITYLIRGRMRHRDNRGHEGLLESGDLQWMLAGKGIIHSEMPEQEEGQLEGFQLWLNLPAINKMDTPDYRDIASNTFPVLHTSEEHLIKVLIGGYQGLQGPIQRPITEPLLLDIHCETSKPLNIPIPTSHTACLYVYEGAISVGETSVQERQLAILNNIPEALSVELSPRGPCRVLLMAGKPLNEPVVQYGPFVMNTQDEIQAAVRDYQEGRFS